MSATFTDDEIETLRKGAMGAGLLVSVSDRGFFDTFKEAGALSKHVAAAHEHSDSAARQAGGRGPRDGLRRHRIDRQGRDRDARRAPVGSRSY